jgi:L-iditol 2-dehydrogenase
MESTMLAAIYHGIEDIRLQEVECPAIADDEILLKIKVAFICGTDLRIISSGHPKIPPGTNRILGHELSGEVVKVGKLVKHIPMGMRVTVATNIGCGMCWQCIRGNNHLCSNWQGIGISLDGAFVEYMRIPAAAIRQGNLIPIPENVSFEEAALNEPLSCCYNGFLACRLKPGDVVLIIGAGPIGIMHLFLARLSGARKVIISEMVEDRLAQALDFGADLAINPSQEDLRAAVLDTTDGRGADAIIVAAPSPEAQEQTLYLAAKGGRINFFGGLPAGKGIINFNSNLVHYKELAVTGTTGSSTHHFRRTMELLATRRIDLSPLVSARFPLAQIGKALTLAKSKEAFKVALVP